VTHVPPQTAAVRQPQAHAVLPRFSFAFQPIVDASAGKISSYEALVRGCNGESAFSVLERVGADAMPAFDERARVVAIELAARLAIGCRLNLNLLPRSVMASDAPLNSTVAAAERSGIPLARIVLEATEGEVIDDHVHFARVVNRYREMGMKFAIDDFGAGYSGLNLLADFQPDMVKLDMNLVRGIDSRGPRQAIVRAIVQACGDLGIDVLAEGVETVAEYLWFRSAGVDLYQGHLFAKPGFECLPGFRDPGLPLAG
jgi:EAL domain-containing protein (putative c-di-GMP-specific phosphodiesterase class I)